MDKGASASQTGLSPSVEPVPVSPADAASIPSAVENTDRELWRETPGDYYSPSVHVTVNGMIGINVGGTVVVQSPSGWHALYEESHRTARIVDDNRKMRDAGCDLAEAAMRVVRTYDGVHRLANKIAEWASVIADEGGRWMDAPHSGKRSGGIARAAKLSPERRSEIAKNAAAARWGARDRDEHSESEDAERLSGEAMPARAEGIAQ